MRKISLLIIFIVIGCNVPDPIAEYQLSLISEEITGSNVFKVVKDGKVIYNQTVNSGKLGDKDISDETIFPIWSMSKPITTVAMMILYDRGLYKLDDYLSKYLPEYENVKCKGEEGVYPCKNKIRVIHLLTHRSGYTYYSDVYGENKFISPPSPLNKFTSSYYFDNLDDFSKAVANHPLEFEPGSHYLYGINQAILGRLVEVLSGMSFYDFLKENLFDPMKMTETKFYLTKEDRVRVQPLFINRLPNTPFNPSETVLKGFTYLLDEQTYDINKDSIHWIPQNNHVEMDGYQIVDFVGKYENLEVDWKYVADKIQVSDKLPFVGASNTGKNNPETRESFQKLHYSRSCPLFLPYLGLGIPRTFAALHNLLLGQMH